MVNETNHRNDDKMEFTKQLAETTNRTKNTVFCNFSKREGEGLFQSDKQRKSFHETGRNDCGARYGGIRMD